MVLDYPSILFFLVLNNLFIIALFTYQYFYHYKEWYLLLYTLGIALQTMGIIIFAKSELLPQLLAIRIINIHLILSILFTSFGLLSFDGRLRKKVLWIFIILGLLFYTLILTLGENKGMITVVRILACSFFYIYTASILFRHKKNYKSAKLISSVLLTFIMFQLVRAYHIFQIGESYDFNDNTSFDSWFLAVTLFVINASSIGFIMLLKEIDEKTILDKNKIIQQDKLKMRQLNETQNKLFSIIAHDLRSPFNHILGLSTLLKEKTNTTKNSESNEYVDLINKTATNTLSLLDNLLDWSNSQTAALRFNPKKINLTKIIAEIVALKLSSAQAKNISLHYSPKQELIAYTDENMLKTVLRNLINNAIKFTNLGGVITILVTKETQQVEISITDNGIGMSKETIREILDSNTSNTSTGTAGEKGSGLGLVLCRELIKKLNGELYIESEREKGSTFKFTLPLKN